VKAESIENLASLWFGYGWPLKPSVRSVEMPEDGRERRRGIHHRWRKWKKNALSRGTCLMAAVEELAAFRGIEHREAAAALDTFRLTCPKRRTRGQGVRWVASADWVLENYKKELIAP
jgi:hypothetical protein